MRTPFLLALALCPGLARAQESAPSAPPPEPRATVAGRVVGPDGEPWAGATVVLCAHTTPAARELGDRDVVETRTTTSGIFRAKVLPGLDYSAWAWLDTPEGTRLRTELRHDLVPGGLAELRAGPPQKAREAQVFAAPDWDGLRPFSLRLVHDHPDLPEHRITSNEDGVFALPPLPPGAVELLVIDRDGQPLFHASRSSNQVRSNTGRVNLTLPPAVEIPVRVLDLEKRPIAGAEIRYQIESGFCSTLDGEMLLVAEHQVWRLCGATDADGQLTVRLPLEFDPLGATEEIGWGDVLFAASAPGRSEAHSGLHQKAVFLNGVRTEDEVDELLFRLAAAEPLTGRLVAAPGQPLAGTRVLVTAASKMNEANNGWTHLQRRFVAETDTDGRWSIPSMPTDAHYLEVACRIPEALRTAWTIDDVAPSRTLALAASERPAPVETDLSDFRAVRVALRDPEQGPATGVQLESLDLERPSSLRPHLPSLHRVDRRGSVLLYRPPGRHGLLALDEEGLAHTSFEVPTEGEGPLDVSLDLKPWPLFRVRVLGPDREPPETVTARDAGASWSGTSDPFLEQLRTALRPVLRAFTADAEWQDGVLTVRCVELERMTRRLEVRSPGFARQNVEIFPTDGEPETLTLEKDG